VQLLLLLLPQIGTSDVAPAPQLYAAAAAAVDVTTALAAAVSYFDADPDIAQGKNPQPLWQLLLVARHDNSTSTCTLCAAAAADKHTCC
jgi:hypothetical protein